jgi:hypothetical protein
MLFEVTGARYVKDYEIELHFEDGASGTVDLEHHMEHGTILEQLRDKDLFQNFKVEYGTVTWKNGELDIAPETLYTEATGREIHYAHPTGLAL